MPPLKHRRPLQAAAFGLAVISTLAFSGLFTRQPAPRYTVTDLGVLPGHAVSQAVAVNSRGDVVGSADPLGSGSEQAYLYQGGKMQDLNNLISKDADWTLEDASGINDRARSWAGACTMGSSAGSC